MAVHPQGRAQRLIRVQGYCGDYIVTDPAREEDSVCNVPCRDDADESCGGLKLLKRAQKAVAAYSSTLFGTSTATTQRSSTAASSAAFTGGISSSSGQSFSRYANTTSSTPASSQSVTTSSTSALPYGCTDLACVTLSEANAGRNGAASTSSLPFGCDSKFLS